MKHDHSQHQSWDTVLDGEIVLPGFKIVLSSLFGDK